MAFFSEEMDAALERYVDTRSEHKEMASRGRGLDPADRKSWQAEVDRLSRSRRACHNAAARVALTHGLADRRPDLPTEEELSLARNKVKDLLEVYLRYGRDR